MCAVRLCMVFFKRVEGRHFLHLFLVYIQNHTSVWGSYWSAGQWGYACCHSLVKPSYCTGRAGIEASENMLKLAVEQSERRAAAAAAGGGEAAAAGAADKGAHLHLLTHLHIHNLR